jgi:large subunit ribosomal protein L6
MPIPIPEGVEADVKGSRVTIKGPRGDLMREFHPDISIALKDGKIVVTRPSDERMHRSLHGLTRALLANMVQGVTEGFRKRLVISGMGYRAEQQSENAIVLQVGYSHPVRIVAPPEITLQVEKGYRAIVVEGADKELVGEIAARIRRVRKPEPYKGKGIAYEDERIRRKAGKAGRVGGVGG